MIALATVNNGKITIVAGVTQDQTQKIKAGELANMLAQQVGGKGGGKPELAEAGGNQPEQLDVALQSANPWIQARLSAG